MTIDSLTLTMHPEDKSPVKEFSENFNKLTFGEIVSLTVIDLVKELRSLWKSAGSLKLS